MIFFIQRVEKFSVRWEIFIHMPVLNGYERIDLLIIESAFANHDIELAKLARHFCPSLLAAVVARKPDMVCSAQP